MIWAMQVGQQRQRSKPRSRSCSRRPFPPLVCQSKVRRDSQSDRGAGLYDAIWQAFAALLPVKTVGVMGDGPTYDHLCALRAATSTDGMTADYYPFPHDLLGHVATRIINEVRAINRVVYNVTSKPPGTIKWGAVKGRGSSLRSFTRSYPAESLRVALSH
jgi:hypothetical protein